MRLTLFKFPFVALELALAVIAVKAAWILDGFNRFGALSVALIAIFAAVIILNSDEPKPPQGDLRPPYGGVA